MMTLTVEYETYNVALQRIQALEEELKEARRVAATDRLTGLGNLRVLDQTKGEGWYVLADLNGFKAAQDAHPDGHAHGDKILREFAAFLVKACRVGSDEDKVALRRGGDEFLVRCGSEVGAKAVAERLRVWEYAGVTAAVGLGTTVEAADAAMYLDKRQTR